NYVFDVRNQQLIYDDNARQLTEREAHLLSLLCEYKGRLLPREKVLKSLWNQNDYFTRRSMDVFISRLRKYLSADEKVEIQNVYGSGFILKIKNEH
ncbi:MAG: winged helix-turn-helix domain-containing protein, partial [Chitinophagales bacterium]|nr:winged helix-turn-helix domain-containing protein [Chitinophagales bacterium]